MAGPPVIQGVVTAKILAQHAKAALREVTELGNMDQMTSPALVKIGEAFVYATKACAYADPDAIAPGSIVLHTVDSARVHVAWLPASCTLVLAFKGPGGPEIWRYVVKDWLSVQPCANPVYLKGAAAGTEVHAGFQQLLSTLLHPPDGSPGLLACMRRLSGGAPPRRILATGYCTGGALATLAAVWAALQCPTADVRCITFGAQRVGNATFANVFRWLVGNSYRCVYGRDPFPNKKAVLGGMVPVHGIIFMDEQSLGATNQPFYMTYNIQDHHLVRYARAIRAACVRAAMAEEEAAAANPAAAAQPDAYMQVGDSANACKEGSEDGATLGRSSTESSNFAGNAAARSPPPSSAPTTTADTAASRTTPCSSETPQTSPMRRSSGGSGLLSRWLWGSSGPGSNPSYSSAPGGGTLAAPPPKAPSAMSADFLARLDEVNELVETTMPVCGGEVVERKPGGSVEAQQCELEPERNLGERVLGAVQGAGDVLAAASGAAAAGVAGAAGAASLGVATAGDAVLKRLGGERKVSNARAGAGAGVGGGAEHAARAPCTAAHVPYAGNVASTGACATAAGGAPALEGDDGSKPGPLARIRSGTRAHSEGPQDSRTGSSSAGNEALLHSPSSSGGCAGGGSLASSALEGSERTAAASYIQQCMEQATGAEEGGGGGMARERGTNDWLTRAFSLLEREDLDVDMAHLGSLEKVLVIGKLSQAVVVAMAAYQGQEGFRRLTGIPRTRYINSTGYGAQVHVAWLEGGTAVFAFRGTESAQDGLQDVKFMRRGVDFLQAHFPGAKAHTGFLQQFADVVDPARPEDHIGGALRQLSGGRVPTRVLCTGHSLGGALATLAAAWAAIEYPDADVRCITFGSPRVGNTRFKLAFHTLVGTSLRVVYGADPVPSVPPALRYHHVKGAIYVRRKGLVLRSRPWHVKYRPNLADHFLTRYNLGVYSQMPDGTVVPDKRAMLAEAEQDKPERSASCIHFILSRSLETESTDKQGKAQQADTRDNKGEAAAGTSPSAQRAAPSTPEQRAANFEGSSGPAGGAANAAADDAAASSKAAARCQHSAAMHAAGALERRHALHPLRPLLRRLGGSWRRQHSPQAPEAA